MVESIRQKITITIQMDIQTGFLDALNVVRWIARMIALSVMKMENGIWSSEYTFSIGLRLFGIASPLKVHSTNN
jgi:2-methylisocitrate lyase-like PEP mutase family enzyme